VTPGTIIFSLKEWGSSHVVCLWLFCDSHSFKIMSALRQQHLNEWKRISELIKVFSYVCGSEWGAWDWYGGHNLHFGQTIASWLQCAESMTQTFSRHFTTCGEAVFTNCSGLATLLQPRYAWVTVNCHLL
jgi:hypothetical protein